MIDMNKGVIMPKKKTDKKPEKKVEVKKPEVLTKKINGKLIFKRISTFGDLGFDVESDGVLTGKKISFYSFLPGDFKSTDLAKYEITGSVTYKINVKRL